MKVSLVHSMCILYGFLPMCMLQLLMGSLRRNESSLCNECLVDSIRKFGTSIRCLLASIALRTYELVKTPARAVPDSLRLIQFPVRRQLLSTLCNVHVARLDHCAPSAQHLVSFDRCVVDDVKASLLGRSTAFCVETNPLPIRQRIR